MASKQKSETDPQVLLFPLAPLSPPCRLGSRGVYRKTNQPKQTKKEKRGENTEQQQTNKEPKPSPTGKGDAPISVPAATGNTTALCNLAYCISGLFSALRLMLLARESKVGCELHPSSVSVSSWLPPQAQAAPGCFSPSCPEQPTPLSLAQQTATSMEPSPVSGREGQG